MSCAGMLVYAGPFTHEYRDELSRLWLGICHDEGMSVRSEFSLARTLSTPSEIRQWALEGLPSDAASLENAILVSNCIKCPLLIDPQGQATRWYRNRQFKRQFKEFSSSDPDMLRLLSEAVIMGMIVLVTLAAPAMDPAMEALITKAVTE